MSEGQLDNQENYRTEYKEVSTTFRFGVSLRFIVAAFNFTIQSTLLNVYNQTLQQPKARFLFIISTIGVTTMIAVFAIESRNITVFSTMMQRGKELEFKLGLIDGHFSRLSELRLGKPRRWRRFLTHTWGISLIYATILILWTVLLIPQLTKQ